MLAYDFCFERTSRRLIFHYILGMNIALHGYYPLIFKWVRKSIALLTTGGKLIKDLGKVLALLDFAYLEAEL